MKRLVWQDRPRGISVWVLDDDGPNVVARLRYHWCCLRMQGIADTGVIYHHNERKVTQLFDYEPSTIHLVAEGRDGEALGAVRIVADTERGLPMENRGDWAEVGWPGYDLTGFRKKKNIAHGTAREIGMLVTAPSTGGGETCAFQSRLSFA